MKERILLLTVILSILLISAAGVAVSQDLSDKYTETFPGDGWDNDELDTSIAIYDAEPEAAESLYIKNTGNYSFTKVYWNNNIVVDKLIEGGETASFNISDTPSFSNDLNIKNSGVFSTAWYNTTITVTSNSAPSAGFEANNAIVGQDYSLSETSSDFDGKINSYEWDLDDDGTFEQTGESVTISSKQDESTYNYSLRVTDNDQATDTITKTVTLQNALPSPDFIYSPSNFETGENVTFDASLSSDTDGDTPLSFYWDLDDDGDYEKTEETIETSFSENKEYDITLKVKDSEGETDTKTITITPNNSPPDADFSILTTNIEDKKDILFEDSSTDPDGSISSTKWYVSGDQVSTGNDLSYTFENEGEYLVKIEVEDDDGSTDVYDDYVTVEERSNFGGGGASGLPGDSDMLMIVGGIILIVLLIRLSG